MNPRWFEPYRSRTTTTSYRSKWCWCQQRYISKLMGTWTMWCLSRLRARRSTWTSPCERPRHHYYVSLWESYGSGYVQHTSGTLVVTHGFLLWPGFTSNLVCFFCIHHYLLCSWWHTAHVFEHGNSTDLDIIEHERPSDLPSKSSNSHWSDVPLRRLLVISSSQMSLGCHSSLEWRSWTQR